jgi:type I restriction-modification system DNA methylase subunit
MKYRYAEKSSFQYLAAGGVIKSYKGNTNFPVRLGHEIFNRCLCYVANKEKVTIYDPMCGSGYFLTTVGFLNFNRISKIYGSDVNYEVIRVAEKNLKLLTKEGIEEREKEIQYLYDKYKRDSFKISLQHFATFKDTVIQDMNYKLFKRDLFEESVAFNLEADIIIMDLPYNNLVTYKGNYSKTKLEERIVSLAQNNTIVAVIRNKAQKISIESNLNRLEKIKTGKRVIEIFKNAVH